MITRVTYETLHRYGKAFHSQFLLRHECFIERQAYNVSRYNGMEYDQYDTPAAVYLVYQDASGEALGCSRLTPVGHGSMLQDLWPVLVTSPQEVFRPGVWEGTRFCIKKDLPPLLRRRICQELVVAYFEACLDLEGDMIIGVMPPYILRKVFKDAGCHYTLLGNRSRIENGDRIVAASMSINREALAVVREITNISEEVIADDTAESALYRAA